MKRFRKLMRQCPLAVCILCGWGVLAAGKYLPALKQQMEQGQPRTELADTGQEPEGEGAYGGAMAANHVPELTWEELAQTAEPQEIAAAGQNKEEGQPRPGSAEARKGQNSKEPQSAEAEEPEEEEPQKIMPEYISYDKKKTDSPYYTDPGKIPMTTEYDYVEVADDYFDDAVFIGDSRMEGMEDYSGLDNATFFAKPGLTVYDLLDDKFIRDGKNEKKVSVSDMLKRNTYGKIYLMVGINELGTGGTQRFADAYKHVLKKFRKWQPDAVIYVHSIMGVSPAKERDAVFNNTNIRDKNYAISQLTDGIHIFYFNIQQLYEDKNHNLKQELTFDDVHLYAKHYRKWVDYLREHAVEEKEQ